MARRYDVAVSALALGIEPKWIDNVLSHFALPGVEQEAQGKSRRLDDRAVLRLAVLIRLQRDLGIPIGKAIPLASQLVDAGSVVTGDVVVTVDVERLRDSLAAQLANAVEVAVAPVRGRPPQRVRGSARGGT
jgi:hypothetical protein